MVRSAACGASRTIARTEGVPSFETAAARPPQDEGWETRMPDAPKLLIPLFGRIYAIFAPFTELLIRLIAGGSLALHGYQILFGNIEGDGRFLESVGYDNGLLWAWIVGILEFVCGLLLAIGLLTRVGAGPIIPFLIVA